MWYELLSPSEITGVAELSDFQALSLLIFNVHKVIVAGFLLFDKCFYFDHDLFVLPTVSF